jgi:hypothetical protein
MLSSPSGCTSADLPTGPVRRRSPGRSGFWARPCGSARRATRRTHSTAVPHRGAGSRNAPQMRAPYRDRQFCFGIRIRGSCAGHSLRENSQGGDGRFRSSRPWLVNECASRRPRATERNRASSGVWIADAEPPLTPANGLRGQRLWISRRVFKGDKISTVDAVSAPALIARRGRSIAFFSTSGEQR